MLDKQSYVDDLIDRVREILNELESVVQVDSDFELPYELVEQLLAEVEQISDY